MKKLLMTGIIFLILISSGCGNKKEKIFGVIQNCSELATLKVTLSKCIFAEQVNRILMIPIGKSKFVAQSEVILKYGIRLDKIKKEDIEITDNKIKIKLPPVELLDFNYPPKLDVIEEYTTMRNWVTQITNIMQQAEDSVRKNLKYLDMEDECKQKTTLMLTRIFNDLGFDDIEIEYKSE